MWWFWVLGLCFWVVLLRVGFGAAGATRGGASRQGGGVSQIGRVTPWDRSRWKFSLRLAHNLYQDARHDSRLAWARTVDEK